MSKLTNQQLLTLSPGDIQKKTIRACTSSSVRLLGCVLGTPRCSECGLEQASKPTQRKSVLPPAAITRKLHRTEQQQQQKQQNGLCGIRPLGQLDGDLPASKPLAGERAILQHPTAGQPMLNGRHTRDCLTRASQHARDSWANYIARSSLVIPCGVKIRALVQGAMPCSDSMKKSAP